MATLTETPATEAPAAVKPKQDVKPRRQPPYNVVLLDDDDHTYEYVVEMLGKIFGHSKERAFVMAVEVDATGRVIVDTTTRERAELKRDQIHAYGTDRRIAACKGSMSALIEPAPDPG
jgi:ATP-dependent Clp protease adaptor protein ClpS